MLKKFPTNCVPMSVRRYDGIPHGIFHASKNVHAPEVVVVLAVGTVLIGFEYLSAIINTCRLPSVVLDSGPKISTTTNSNGHVAGRSCRRRLCLRSMPLLAQL